MLSFHVKFVLTDRRKTEGGMDGRADGQRLNNMPPIFRYGGIKIIMTTKSSIKYLTHYQTTNFRLFQTERVCRRQFQIWRKWQKVIQTGRKHCGKRRNCSLRAISPFPAVFSKGLFPRGCQKVSLCGNGLIDVHTSLLLIFSCYLRSIK